MKARPKKTELRGSLSISLLPSEKEAVRTAALNAGENSVSAFVKKVLMKAIAAIDKNENEGGKTKAPKRQSAPHRAKKAA
ncbi:MAG: hypothetical protein WAN16_03640 [Chthoniobacterales bacterium]